MKRVKSSPSIGQHPLMGASLRTLVNALITHGGVSAKTIPHMLIFLGSAIGRLPFSLLERWKTRNMLPDRELEPPVFIVGYWRSGTTHLHNLLGKSPEMGIITPLASGLPGELLTLATWLQPLLEKGLPEDRGVDHVAVTPNSPQEDEIPLANRQTLSVFHALYFGRHFSQFFQKGVFFDGADESDIENWKNALLTFLAKVARQQLKQPLLIKNPVYTARIDLLRSIWPNARFIHIYRNPYTVYHSTVRYYHKMLKTLSLQPYDASQIEPVVQNSYPRMMAKLYKDTADLSSGQFAEVKYEELDSNPIDILENLYFQLQLPGWNHARPRTRSYLKQISGYKKNPHDYEPGLKQKVDNYWGKYIDKWSYEFPER